MKTKTILMIALVGLAVLGALIISNQARVTAIGGKKVLYYTCAMHPWVRESKPGACPVCGMNLTPIYANENSAAVTTNSNAGEVTLEPESISTINVQTELVTNRPIQFTLHLSGQIVGNSRQAAWFEFTTYQRDLEWLKIGQTLQVVVEGAPDKIFTAQIKLHAVKPFTDGNFDMMTSSTTIRAEISNAPVEIGSFGKSKLFNGLHAEAHLVAETETILTIPRSAIISRGMGTMVYVDKGNGHYESRSVSLGRIGDKFAEVLGGLKQGEKVVTNGNVLIDSEAQLTAGE